MRIFAPPQNFLLGEKLPKSSGITHMVTSNGGHPLHHHLTLRQAVQCPLQQKNHQANLHTVAASLQFTPQWPSRPLISTPVDRVQSYLTLYFLDLSRSRTRITPKKQNNLSQSYFNEMILESCAPQGIV